MKSENVLGELNIYLSNMPNNITPLEKVRWLYIKLGRIFSYDYEYIVDYDYHRDYDYKYDLDGPFLNRYQTCIQISKIFNELLNNIDGVKSEVIPRTANVRGIYEKDHLANLVTIGENKYILDLTLDLYLIQSGSKTREFGYTTINGDESVISQRECAEMDQKMGLIKNGEYTDTMLERAYKDIRTHDFKDSSFEEEMKYKFDKIRPYLYSFPGYIEGKNYMNDILIKILNCEYKEFNLTYMDNKIVCVYMLKKGTEKLWYLYDGNGGLIESNSDNISNMLNSGWTTRSNSIYDYLDDDMTL